jgi:hypothetical protein
MSVPGHSRRFARVFSMSAGPRSGVPQAMATFAFGPQASFNLFVV